MSLGRMAAKGTKELTNEHLFQKNRRDFLGKSKYAVYMTPLMLSMIVDKDAHANSVSCSKGPNPTC